MLNNEDNFLNQFFAIDYENKAEIKEISTIYFPTNNGIIPLDEESIQYDREKKLEEQYEKPEESSEIIQTLIPEKIKSNSKMNKNRKDEDENCIKNLNLQTIDGKSTESHTESNAFNFQDSSIIIEISSHNENEEVVEKKQILQQKAKKTYFQIEKIKPSRLFTPLNEQNENERKIKKVEKKAKTPRKELDKRRKNNSDNIRKRIKVAFLKATKIALNKKLKAAGSKKFFTFLPQVFVSNVSRGKNSIVLELSLEEILSKQFYKENDGNANIKKYLENCSVLNYLKSNKSISEKSGFEKFKKMYYSQLYKEYLHSREFQQEICRLTKNNEKEKYIQRYISKARSFISFFEAK